MTNSDPSSPSSSDVSLLTNEEWELREQAIREMEWRLCSRDPWYFITKYCKIKDPNRPKLGARLIDERCHGYLAPIVRIVHQERFVAIEKSRQMVVTNVLCAYFLWMFLFQTGSRICYQNKREDDAKLNLSRSVDIYLDLPEWMQERVPVKIGTTKLRTNRASKSDNSIIFTVPEGPDIIRGEVFTVVWSDETSVQPNAGGTYKAIRPALGGKGSMAKYIASFTAHVGFAHMLVSDKLDVGKPPPPLFTHTIVDGLTHRQLAKNRFHVLRLLYTADPEKRDPAWKQEMMASMSLSDWQQEYEIDYDAKSGAPALPLLTEYQSSIVITPFPIPDWWPRYAIGDYGTRNPYACLFVAVGPDGCSYAYWEYYSPGPLGVHLDIIKAHPDFPGLQAYILDRACWNQDQQASMSLEGQTTHSLKSIAELHQDAGVSCIPAARVMDPVKVAAWDRAWLPLQKGAPPSFKIFAPCVNFVRELEGARWQEYSDALQRIHNLQEKLVDRDNHLFDCGSYWLLFRSEAAIDVVPELTPQQAWQQQQRSLVTGDIERKLQEIEDQRQEDSYYGESFDEW